MARAKPKVQRREQARRVLPNNVSKQRTRNGMNFSTLQLNGFLNLGPCNRTLLYTCGLINPTAQAPAPPNPRSCTSLWSRSRGGRTGWASATPTTTSYIGEVEPGSSAHAQGDLQYGDQIVSWDGSSLAGRMLRDVCTSSRSPSTNWSCGTRACLRRPCRRAERAHARCNRLRAEVTERSA